jgi:serine/threonine protein kinase
VGVWQIEGFTEVRELGSGAQGRVVLARHDASGTPVAVKYLAVGADAGRRARLRHEAAMLAKADSAHVARLYQLVETAEGAALVMEAVDGASLKTVLEHHGALGPEAALTVLKGSLLGLARRSRERARGQECTSGLSRPRKALPTGRGPGCRVRWSASCRGRRRTSVPPP